MHSTFEPRRGDIYVVVFVIFALSIGSALCQPHPPMTIAFASDVSGDWEIYLTDTTGRRPVNLTQNPAADYYPTWHLMAFRSLFFLGVMGIMKFM